VLSFILPHLHWGKAPQNCASNIYSICDLIRRPCHIGLELDFVV
jgi:hypothetical protein